MTKFLRVYHFKCLPYRQFLQMDVLIEHMFALFQFLGTNLHVFCVCFLFRQSRKG